jgi:translocation protein SEC72
MKLELDQFGQYKTYIHIGQAVVLFLAWALTIAVLTRSGSNDGRVGWYFGLVCSHPSATDIFILTRRQCWLTIPILIYLTMVPMWSRARRFSNIYAFAALDMLSVVLWLSAWASMASYVAQGKSEGSDDPEKDGSGCDNFKYGSAGRCQLSTGTTVLGVFIMLGFLATSLFSFRKVMEYKRTGIAPTEERGSGQKYGGDFQQQTQGDFDSNMHGNDDFDDTHDGRQQGQGYGYSGVQGHDHEEAAPMYQYEHPGDIRPQEPMSPLGPTPTAPYGFHTSYGGMGELHDRPTGYGGGAGGYGR